MDLKSGQIGRKSNGPKPQMNIVVLCIVLTLIAGATGYIVGRHAGYHAGMAHAGDLLFPKH